MNFAKQWVEYSPVGAATAIKSGNTKEQLAKSMLGSAVTLMGAYAALEGRTTWAAPTDPKEKELFYASGRKPFSVQIGDKWVSMMYAGPFAMALALPAAVKYYQTEDRKALTDSQMQKIGKMTSSMAEFLSGQTFLEGVGNFVSLVKGDTDYSFGKNLVYTASQMIPMQGLVRYITTALDPVYRKAKTMGEQFKSNIPFYSETLQPYTNPAGEPSTREKRNLFTPYDVTQQKPEWEEPLQQRQKQLQTNAVINEIENAIERGEEPKPELIKKVGAAEESPTSAVDEKIAKAKLKYSDETKLVSGNTVYYKDNGSIRSLNTEWEEPDLPEGMTDEPWNDEFLKKQISNYKTEITRRQTTIMKLYELGELDYNDAMEEYMRLDELKKSATEKVTEPKEKKTTSTGTGRRRKKISPPPLKIKKISTMPVRSRTKINRVQLKTTSLPKVKFRSHL